MSVNPVTLSDEHVTKLRDLKAVITNIAAELDRAEKAGLDVTSLRAQLSEAENLRAGLLRVYGPTTRRRT